jgi:hypothetical protein
MSRLAKIGLAPWKRPYQAKLLIDEKTAAFSPVNFTGKDGNNKPSLRL